MTGFGTRGAPSKKPKASALKKTLVGSGIGLSVLSLTAMAVLAGSYANLEGNIEAAPLYQPDEVERETQEPIDYDDNTDPIDILLMGTDTRVGNENFGTSDDSAGGGNADVMMAVHISAD